MSRLGMLYALTDTEVDELRSVPVEERYDYMLNEIEEKLFDTPRACELDKAWEEIQYCFGGGEWIETNSVPANIIFGGEFLVKTEDEVITLKNHDNVKYIVEYLHQNDPRDIVNQNFEKLVELFRQNDPQDIVNQIFQKSGDDLGDKDDGLEYTLDWSCDILPFYENALKENLQVIFTVDF